MSESLQYSPAENDNDHAVNLATSGGVANVPEPDDSDPDEPMDVSKRNEPDPDGDDDALIDLSKEDEVIILDQLATDTPDYGGPMMPTQVLANVYPLGGWIPEDNDNQQHTDGTYAPGGALEPSSEYGASINVALSPASLLPGMTPPEKNDGYLSSISLAPTYFDINDKGEISFTPVSGKFFTQGGREVVNGMRLVDYAGNAYSITVWDETLIISIDSTTSTWKPVDLSQLALTFRPDAPNSDRDIFLNTSITATHALGASTGKTATAQIYVDAVADKPIHTPGEIEDVVIGPEGGTLDASNLVYENGMAVTILGAGGQEAGNSTFFSLGSVTFDDYTDGSEQHYLLLAADDPTLDWSVDPAALAQQGDGMFVVPSSGELETVWLDADGNKVAAGTPDAREYVRIDINNASLAATGGTVNVTLPVLISGATENGVYQFDAKACAEEITTPTPFEQEIDPNNNFAVTDLDAVQVHVQNVAANIRISTGWAYESGAVAGGDANPDADPAGTGMADGQSSQTLLGVPRSAAPVKIAFTLGEDESLGQWITLDYDASLGDMYFNGSKVNSTSNGRAFVTLPTGNLKTGELTVWFVPNPQSSADADFDLHYAFTVTKGSGENAKTFTADGELPIVIDAVARPAETSLGVSDEAPETDGFSLACTVNLGTDSAETHYLVISNPDGLLALGDPGAPAAGLTQVTADELRAFEHADPAVGHHFADLGADDIILRIDNPAGLTPDADGGITLDLPFVVTDRATAGDSLDVSIATVVVEGKGNNAALWGQGEDREYDFANNIAVTDATFTVHLARGEMTLAAPGIVYEGDSATHGGEPLYGSPLPITFADAFEAVRDISFTLSAADGSSAVDGAVTFGVGTDYQSIPTGGSLRLTAEAGTDAALYSGAAILNASGDVVKSWTFPATTLEALAASGNASGLRFIPSGDGDADVVVGIASLTVTDSRSGDRLTVPAHSLPSVTIVRDAVADTPQEVSAAVTPAEGYDAVVADRPVTLHMDAAFSDVSDGSEAHYLFISKDNLASVAIPAALTSSLTLLAEDEASAVCAQIDGAGGIPDATAAGYFIIRVGANALTDGTLNLSLEATLRPDLAPAGNAQIDVRAVSVEHEGFLTAAEVGTDNAEPHAANNVSVAEAPADIVWATLENVFTFTATPAAEDDLPTRHLPGTHVPAGGAHIRITPQDAGEVFDTLTISYADEEGNAASGAVMLDLDGQDPVSLASGTTLTFTYAAVSSPLCTAVSFTDADGTHTFAVPNLTLEEFSAQSLRYVPAADGHSDADVIVTFSGRTRETASGEEGDFAAHSVQVMVDAVADKPAGTMTDYNYGTDAEGNAREALPEGSAVSFAVNVAFADYEDGSEAHYLFINTKYFADDSLQLLTGDQAFAGGSLLTEAERDALLAQVNGNPGLIPGENDAYVVWKLDEAYLRAHNGNVSLTVAAALKDAAALDPIGPQKTLLDLNVKAVAVEHAGYLTPEADAASGLNDETDATNNVSVTEVGTQIRWDALLGQVDMTAETAWEDDRSGQHTGDETAEGGANLTIAMRDASEVLTSLTLNYDATHGDLVLRLGDDAPLALASGSELTFTFDAADRTAITGLSVGGTALTVPGLTLAELTGQSLFYVPHADNADADVTVSLTGRTLETNTGVRGETQGSVVIVTDAVADRPTDVSAELVVTHGKGDTVILNEEKGLDSFDLTLSAAFADYEDGSESHYFLVSGQYLASLSDLPEGISLLAAEDAAAVVAAAGLSGEYFVLDVPGAVLVAGSGTVDFTVTAHLDPASLPAEGTVLHLDIRAAAIEHQGLNTPEEAELGNGHGQDALAANNVSLVDAGLDLHYARLDNDFPEDVVDAYEGDMPDQHQPNPLPVDGAAVPFAPADPSEVFDTLSVAYADGEGRLTLDLPTLEEGNTGLELADGAQLAFVYRNDALVKEVILTQDGESATFTLSPQLTLNELLGGERLRYTPDTASQSDADVVITFSGTSRETATGESGSFSHAVTVRVDASADLPIEASGAAGNKQADRPALEPGKTFTLAVNANFGEDRADGSERHYVFISRDYLSALTVSESLAAAVTLLAATDAAAVCAQVDGAGGLPGASADDYFVLSVNDEWLRDHEGRIELELDAVLKDAATLATAGAEGESLDLAMKAVAVEHQGFQTPVEADLGNGHGQESRADNNVAVRDASAQFAYAVVDGAMTVEPAPAYEGNQPDQHTGDFTTAEGAAVTLAPQDASEVFTELTLTCDAAHGQLVLSAPDGTAVTLSGGARLVFAYDPEHPAQCLSVQVEQPDGATAPVTLSYAGADGGGLSLAELTAGYLRYVPTANDDSDADVTLSYAGTLLETASGATAPVEGNLTVTVDAVADLAQDAAGSAVVRDPAGGSHSAAQPGETVTVSLRATFDDYADGSEAHYIFIAAEHLPSLNGIPDGVTEVTSSAALADIFSALATPGGTGIHAGTDAAGNYHVLEVSAAFLEESEGHFSMQTTVTAGDVGIHHVEAAAVSVEYDGYRTAVADVDGSGVNRDVTAENNVAVANMSFDIVVREFAPDRITVTPATEWAYENDRSEGDEAYHAPADESGRDNGVALIFSGQGEGNVITSVTFEYPMPSNGSAVPHEIRSSLGEDAVTITRSISDGVVTVTVSAVDAFGSVGDLRFIPGDNYDNDDVPITVTHVDVADPALHQTTAGDPDWGSGVDPAGGQVLVKVDAVAQAPGLENFVVDHDSDNPVQAGGVIHITGKVSYEDTADGSESHFLLLEVLDGYYPDGVTLTHGAQTVTIPVIHYSADPAQAANYTLQQLVTADDGQPHLFIKLPVDDALAALMGETPQERMDGIALDVAYQTREWAAEGTSLHFAAIAAEDVESVREYDAQWNITNDELPFDKQLEQYVPGLAVTDNNTAVTIAAQGAYVFWDEINSDVLNVRGYVFENDRPTDHQRDPAYILNKDFTDGRYDVVYSYPVPPDIEPQDPATGRDFGTGWELEIPDHTRQVSIAELEGNNGNGSFYFLPETVWQAHMAQSPAPGSDAALAAYRVTPGGPAAVAQGDAAYTLVFIPSHEVYTASHGETGPSHKDADYRFSYELLVDQYGSNGQLLGCKQYSGENVIRVDAVANQAELIAAGTTGEDQFSLWAGKDKTTAFDLTVGFHDLDGTEDHYILVETVPNFGFRCGDYTYVPGMDDSLLYTHVMTDADGGQTFIRYYKIPVDAADIDPATGRVTVTVEFVRQPGMPGVADYPASHELTYGALTEDRTTSRWDSQDPAAENFINRVGADGEYTYDNNTSVILRNDIEGGDPGDGGNNPWNPGNITIVQGSGGESGGGIIHWENGPGSGWSGGCWPGGDSEGGGGYWNPDGPAGGGEWWAEQGSLPVGGSTSTEDWIPEGGGLWGQLPGGGGNIGGGSGGDEGGSGGGAWYDNQWIASHQHGLAIEWVFENSTPLGHTEIGQYDRFMFTEIFLTGEVAGADSLKITIPDSVDNGLIVPEDYSPYSDWRFSGNEEPHPRATLYLLDSDGDSHPLSGVKGPDGWEFTVSAVNGELPAGQRLFLMVSPDSKGEDFALSAAWYSGDALLSSGSVDVLVDAVAQWANFGFADHADGVYGVTGESPAELIEVTVDAFFLDQDGSEANYLLVEKIPGVLPLHKDADGAYEPLREVYLDGRTYYRIAPTADELERNKITLQCSVNEDLLSPQHVEALEHDGMSFSGVRLNVGTLTLEGQTGWAAAADSPANWEFTLDNNTALNLREDALSFVISRVNAEGGDSSVTVKETADPAANRIRLDPADPAHGLNLTLDANDVLLALVFTGVSGNGSFWYEDENGISHPLPLNVDMKEAWLDGRIYYEQDRYQDADASLQWTADLRDGLSPNSDVTVGGALTVVVDAVAHAGEIHCGFPALDQEAHTLTQTLRFDDFEANEQHYAVIAPDLYRVVGRQAQVRDGQGTWHAVNVETIFDPSGNPYYAVRLDGYLDAEGAAAVRFELHELNIPGIENFPVISGGVSVEPNTGYQAGDREPDLSDNWAINTRVDRVSEGVVSPVALALDVQDVAEDDPAGAAIALSGQPGENDDLVAADLVFSPAAGSAPLAGQPGDQIATIVYAGQCVAVTLMADGTAVAALDFGAGFDPAADFRLIWGIAHADADGRIVVSAWNHAADASLTLQTDFTLSNRLSGLTATVSGADPDGFALLARADAPAGVSGGLSAVNGTAADPAALVGAAADAVTVTVSGSFADLDGSEAHYLLLEVPEGWQVSAPAGGAYETVAGTRYYRVSVDAAQAAPSVDMTLVSPDGLNGDVTLRTAAQAVEGNGHSAFAQGGDVTLHLSDVSATGLAVALGPVVEDGLLSLAPLGLADLAGNDGNDVLLAVTFTDLQGGDIVTADGTPVPLSPPADQSGLTLTAEQLASGQYFYRPAPDYAGETDAQGRPLPLTLGYSALLGESNTGATAVRDNLSLDLAVIPVADAPENVNAQSLTQSIDTVQTGHKAAVVVRLEADFADVDGSEDHFFLLSGPQGVAVAPGAGYELSLLTAAEVSALTLPDGFPVDGSIYRLTLTDGTAASPSLDVNLDITTTRYNGGSLHVVGGSSERLADGGLDLAFSDAHSVTLPAAVSPGIGNTPPVAEASGEHLDTLRHADVEGSVSGSDADGDSLEPASLSFGATQGTQDSLDGRDCLSVHGAHGTLYLFADNTYRYVLDADKQGVTGTEVFTYALSDGYGGLGEAHISITLEAPNTAPAASAFEAELDSVRQTAVGDALIFQDAENDAVAVVAVNGVTDPVNLGSEAEPRMGFRVTGGYGTLEVWESDGQWRYSYALAADHKGETEDEHFTLTLRDAYGMESAASLTVDLFNVNAAPVAEAATAVLDTLRDADRAVGDGLAVSDADNDAVLLAGAQGHNGAAGQPGTDDLGQPALVVAGQYGTLYLYQARRGAPLSYRYVLGDEAAATGVDGTETFTYTVDDGYLGTGVGSLVITLDRHNTPPVIAGALDAELDTLRDADRIVTGALTFSDADSHPDQGQDPVSLAALSFGETAGTADGQGGYSVNGAYGVFHIDASGLYTYTLSPEHAGVIDTETFGVTVTDAYGASRTETVTIDLLVRNVDPAASSPVVNLNTWRGGGEASDQVELTDADNDPVRISAVSGVSEGVWGVTPEGDAAFVVQGRYGMLYLRRNGAFDYVLNAEAQGISGTDAFSFSAEDGFGGTASGSISINLDNANAAPVISGSITADIGGGIDQYEDGIVRESGTFSWSDADGDAVAAVSVGGEILPASGTLEVEGRYGTLVIQTAGESAATWTYTLRPGLDAEGITDVESFALLIRDVYGAESAQSLTIQLAPLSHAPQCEDVGYDWPVTPEGAPVSYLEGALSFHDEDLNYDEAESLSLSVNNVAVTDGTTVAGQYGSLTIHADGSFTYTTEHIGEDLLETFTYTVTDAAGNSDEAHLYIRLSDDAPAFPGTGTGEAAADAFFMDAPDAAPALPEALPEPPEPLEVILPGVPLPYDADAQQSC